MDAMTKESFDVEDFKNFELSLSKHSLDIGLVKSLYSFIKKWDDNYARQIKKIELFDLNISRSWSNTQINYFIKMFYHIRGHFHVLLWYFGNFAPTAADKEAILFNISEEFGADKESHERLYFRFAEYFDVDLRNEVLLEESYLPFIKKFNQRHLEWFYDHDWPYKMSAFSAYERLDNVDYQNLLELGESIGADSGSLQFFKVHSKADHFQRTMKDLLLVWQENQDAVRLGFEFISSHQIAMWQALSKQISQLQV